MQLVCDPFFDLLGQSKVFAKDVGDGELAAKHNCCVDWLSTILSFASIKRDSKRSCMKAQGDSRYLDAEALGYSKRSYTGLDSQVTISQSPGATLATYTQMLNGYPAPASLARIQMTSSREGGSATCVTVRRKINQSELLVYRRSSVSSTSEPEVLKARRSIAYETPGTS